MTPTREVWSKSVGFLPHKVSVYENTERKGTLYLAWRQDGNWKRRSLQRALRNERGTIDKVIAQWALQQAEQQYARLVAGLPASERAPQKPLTIAEGFLRAFDPKEGKYPVPSAHRKEVERARDTAIVWLGADLAWADVRGRDLRRLWRGRISELRAAGEVGLRGAEVTVARVLAVAQWLRDEELLPATACVPSRKWKQDLRADWLQLSGERAVPTPERPRYTIAESRLILAAAHGIDGRYALLIALGAELRGGQVIRARRTDLDLKSGTFTVWGRGHKRGEVVKLTAGQVRAAKEAITTGYLRDLESHAPDYPLFPAGQMPGGRSGKPRATLERHLNAAPMDMSAMRTMHRLAESKAEVSYAKGRSLYGLRRAAVDGAKALGASREGLQALGGWADSQVPDRIYADQNQEYARDEARTLRAKIRGEELE